jgi:hypothetical protein
MNRDESTLRVAADLNEMYCRFIKASDMSGAVIGMTS